MGHQTTPKPNPTPKEWERMQAEKEMDAFIEGVPFCYQPYPYKGKPFVTSDQLDLPRGGSGVK